MDYKKEYLKLKVKELEKELAEMRLEKQKQLSKEYDEQMLEQDKKLKEAAGRIPGAVIVHADYGADYILTPNGAKIHAEDLIVTCGGMIKPPFDPNNYQ